MHARIRTIVFAFACFSSLTTLLCGQDIWTNVPFSSSEESNARKTANTPNDSQKLQEVIENQLAAIRSYDVSKAYYAFTTRDFQKAVPLETFKQFVKKYSVISKNKNAVQSHTSFKKDFADYRGKFMSTEGDVYVVDIVFVLDDHEWKIHSVSLKPEPRQRTRPLR